MTPAQSRYLKDLREGYGLSSGDAMDLIRACGLKGSPTEWDDAQVEQAAAILLKQGPIYQQTLVIARRAREEFEALREKRRKREQQKQAA